MNIDSLKNCIETLERVRDAHYNQLDASVQAELDEVIAALKRGLDENQPDMGRLSARVLGLIEHIVSLVTNITDWMG